MCLMILFIYVSDDVRLVQFKQETISIIWQTLTDIDLLYEMITRHEEGLYPYFRVYDTRESGLNFV